MKSCILTSTAVLVALSLLSGCDDSAEEATERGKAYWAKGKYDKAIAEYTEAIRLDPEYADAYNNRGLVYLTKGEYDKAILEFTEAIRLDPKFANAYHMRGAAYRSKGEQAKAEADFAKAKELRYPPD